MCYALKVLDTAKMGIWGNIMKLRYGDFIHFSPQNERRNFITENILFCERFKKVRFDDKTPQFANLERSPLDQLAHLSHITAKSHERE